ncbi:MAG TPA: tRNA (guanosine(46)-N7)-methyltransferase TrmB [Gammaproteobacteria bacterium]|nr:tRNA (guanosine(46)-N7)-methyltransferase TrmB [Gammaproteobacteria bacterium]|tara:strand:+ start:1330 stop:2049 length:720 start_codon:yes stop_codon:yes gene_type:complete
MHRPPKDAFSYIRRHGRATKAQTSALLTLKQRYRVNLEAVLATETPIGIEIGFGMGQHLCVWAQARPDWCLIGIELYEPGIGSLLAELEREQIANVSYSDLPAQLFLADIPNERLHEVRIFFPDPWPKKRHHKRRLIQPEFIDSLARVLPTGAEVWLATDWAEYGDWIAECFHNNPHFDLVANQYRGPGDDPASNASDGIELQRERTKFEQRGERLGHAIRDLIFARSDLSHTPSSSHG